MVHVKETSPNKVTEYVAGPNGALARLVNGQLTYMHPDHLGSPREMSNASGARNGYAHYSPFGMEINTVLPQDQGGFTGHIKDSKTGLNYMQVRYYDPVMGRFLSIDPVTFLDTGDPGYFNRYSYVKNDPINLIDPFGEYSSCASFSGEGNAQSCTEIPGVTGAEFDSLDSAAEAAGSALNRLSEQTGNEFGIAFTQNEGGTVSPTVAVSGVVDNITGEATPGRNASGESGAVSLTPLIAGTENPLASAHSHGNSTDVSANMPSINDGKFANTMTKLLGAHESIVFTPSGYPQQTSGTSRRGNYGFGLSKFTTRPTSPAAKRNFENYIRGGR